ncbi:MAG: hypothetical protein RBG13Loki_3438 [Promethearchaeota archaeon CR_4]|nr:MAG: hypothetical protein RBG13Loki_3438 [Candidatus Lokiarchaeota archaeon CR_4]
MARSSNFGAMLSGKSLKVSCTLAFFQVHQLLLVTLGRRLQRTIIKEYVRYSGVFNHVHRVEEVLGSKVGESHYINKRKWDLFNPTQSGDHLSGQ